MYKSEVKLEIFVWNIYEIIGNADFAYFWFEGLEIDPVLLVFCADCHSYYLNGVLDSRKGNVTQTFNLDSQG